MASPLCTFRIHSIILSALELGVRKKMQSMNAANEARYSHNLIDFRNLECENEANRKMKGKVM